VARLESIRQQTFQDFELIVLDDASTDGSLAVINDYARQMPMQVVANETNSGSPFVQWRRGAELGRGKYLWIAESDDYAQPGFLAAMVERLEANPQAGLAYSQSIKVDNDGGEHGTWRDYTDWIDAEHWRQDYVASGTEECGRYLVFANTIPNASAVVLRRELFLQQTAALPPMKLCGDWLAWVKILLASDVCFVSTPLNYHREHQNTVRRHTRYGMHFAEYTIVWQQFARHFTTDRAVRERLRHALNVGWSNQCINMQPADDWKWLLALVPRIVDIAPSRLFPIFLSYAKCRTRRAGLIGARGRGKLSLLNGLYDL
jgi:glycosyltransferase involved in cell wall biosynthesis